MDIFGASEAEQKDFATGAVASSYPTTEDRESKKRENPKQQIEPQNTLILDLARDMKERSDFIALSLPRLRTISTMLYLALADYINHSYCSL